MGVYSLFMSSTLISPQLDSKLPEGINSRVYMSLYKTGWGDQWTPRNCSITFHKWIKHSDQRQVIWENCLAPLYLPLGRTADTCIHSLRKSCTLCDACPAFSLALFWREWLTFKCHMLKKHSPSIETQLHQTPPSTASEHHHHWSTQVVNLRLTPNSSLSQPPHSWSPKDSYFKMPLHKPEPLCSHHNQLNWSLFSSHLCEDKDSQRASPSPLPCLKFSLVTATWLIPPGLLLAHAIPFSKTSTGSSLVTQVIWVPHTRLWTSWEQGLSAEHLVASWEFHVHIRLLMLMVMTVRIWRL